MDWWTPRYLIGYGLIAAGLTGYIVGDQMSARSEARIGPDYNPDDPTDIFQSDEVGKPFRDRDTVPIAWVHGFMIGAGLGIAGMEAGLWRSGQGSGQRFHDTLIGYVEASALTAAVTSLAKPRFGRLRPDFGDRALRYHCSQPGADYGGVCQDADVQPLHVSERRAQRRLNDGKKSFFSGHASNSFAISVYTSLAIGGNHVWTDDASRRGRAMGIGAQTILMGGATYISATRVTDGRHHFSDVVTGAMIGTTIASVSYWRRFDRRGHRRFTDSSSSTSISPTVAYPGMLLTVEY